MKSNTNMASKSRRKLQASSVYVRVLPENCSSGHIDQEGEEATAVKKLHAWSDTSISLIDRHSVEEYDFPTKVLGPEVSQEDMYNEMLPDLMDRFTTGYNVLFFAYGQTGTGKTHTIFGPNSALESGKLHPQWGVFPRVVDDVLKRMEDAPGPGSKYMLFASALEFYLGGCQDLLAKNKQISIGDDFSPRGHTLQRIHSTSDLMPFLDQVRENRTVRATKMNSKTKESEGSSRSHCALMLTLLKLDESRQYTKTTFTIVDFAGAERPGKTGEERKSGQDVLWELYLGKEVSTGGQAFLINYELMAIRSTVVQATEIHLRRKPYSPPKQVATMIQQFIGSCMDGSALLGMVITISQAARNGWETWFTMQYGTDLSKLRAPCRPQKSVNIEKALKDVERERNKMVELLKKTPKEGAPSSKYYPRREVAVRDLSQKYDLLLELASTK